MSLLLALILDEISGAISITLEDAAVASSSAVPVNAESTITLDDAGVAATGTAAVNVVASIALEALITASTASVGVAGAVGIVLDDVAAPPAASVGVTGSATLTLDDVTLSATFVLVPVLVSAAIVLDDLAVSGSAIAAARGALNVTLDDLRSAGAVMMLSHGGQDIVNYGPTLAVYNVPDGSVGWVSTDTVTPPTAASLAGMPADYMLAPDIKDRPWRRLRGDEWTDAAIRQAVMARIAALFAQHRPRITAWQVDELASGTRSFMRDPRLVVRFMVRGAWREVGFEVSRADRNPEGVLRLLALCEPALVPP